MASTDARPVPRKNVAFRVTFPILDADGDLVTGATGLDSEVSKDGGTFANCTNEATEIATSSGVYYLDLTSTEMNADTVAIIVKTSTSGAKTTTLVMYPEEAGDYRVDVVQVSGDGTAADTLELFAEALDQSTGQLDSGSLANGTITAASIASAAFEAGKFASGAFDAVWSVATRLLTAGTNIVLAKGTGVTGFSDLDAAGVRTAVGLASANLDTQLGDIPNNSEFNARTLASADYATATALGTVDGNVDAIKAVTDKLDDTLEDQGGGVFGFTEAALQEAPSGGTAPTVGEIADAVWTEQIGDHSSVSGSTAEQLAAAGAGGDPWATSLPGSYSAGQAGHIVGNSLDAIKTKTDGLTFSEPGIVDAHIKFVAGEEVKGSGTEADPWGPV